MNKSKTAYRKQRLELVSRYASSSLSAKEFCKQHNFPEHQFYYWIKIFRDKKPASSAIRDVNNFVSVKLKEEPQPTVTAPIAELVYPNGIKLKFYYPINFTELRSLIK